MKTRKLCAVLMATALGLFVTAAGVNAEEAKTPTSSAKIAVVLKTLSSPYWKVVAAGARDAAKEHNTDLIILAPPNEDAVEQQMNMVQDVLSQHIDALLFSPSQPPTAVGILDKAKAKHVAVVLVDSGMPASFTNYDSYVGTDNYSAGRIAGEALAAILKKGDKVLLVEGTPGNPAVSDRIDGAEKVLKEAGMIIAAKQPAYSDREKSYTVTQNVLQSQPDIAGVFSGNDEMALGAARALKQSGKHIPVIGVDGTIDSYNAILDGDLYGTVAQGSYLMGHLSVEKALDVLAGKTIEKRIDSGATLVTKETAKQQLDFINSKLK